MTAEQRLLDVMHRVRYGEASESVADDELARILAALREAIAENPTWAEALLPDGFAVFEDEIDILPLVKLGRAVEATKLTLSETVIVGDRRVETALDLLDAIYTDADVERQP